MEPLLPSLHNLPVFFTVVISLLLMAGLSAYVLVYRWLRQRPPGPGFTWLKAGVLLPLLLLTLIWTGLSAAMGVFVGGLSGSWFFLLLGLAVVPVFALLCWGLYLWVRSRTLADVGMLLLVPAFIVTVYSVQRLWLCEPLALSGLGHAQLCTARLYERGEGGAIRNKGTARYWYRAAAEQGVAEAEYQVAGFTREREQQLDWYTPRRRSRPCRGGLPTLLVAGKRRARDGRAALAGGRARGACRRTVPHGRSAPERTRGRGQGPGAYARVVDTCRQGWLYHRDAGPGDWLCTWRPVRP